MEELSLKKFEEAAEKVKEVTLATNLVYSEYFSNQSGNKVYLKPENMQLLPVIMHRVLHMQHQSMVFLQQ